VAPGIGGSSNAISEIKASDRTSNFGPFFHHFLGGSSIDPALRGETNKYLDNETMFLLSFTNSFSNGD
jgi:hypothetical protein